MTLDPTSYDQADFIPGGHDFFERWGAASSSFRDALGERCERIEYGEHEREWLHLIRPDGESKGLFVFIHGGFWRITNAAVWTHLARGALEAGWTVVLPNYPQAPEVRIARITQSIGKAMDWASASVDGPIVISGHSAGGHLALRMAARNAPWKERISHVLSISPLSDLRPLMELPMNEALKIDPEEAQAESPALAAPPSCPVTLWVGAEERPAFLDQARWMSEAWPHATHLVIDGKHHFNVIEALEDKDNPRMSVIL